MNATENLKRRQFMKGFVKQKFESPKIEVVRFSEEDVLTASGDITEVGKTWSNEWGNCFENIWE